MKRIVLFDGECHFCNRSVQFIIKRDPNSFFHFSSLQGKTGKQLRNTYHIPEQIDSLILLEGDRYYLKSTAALKICTKLKGAWKFLALLLVIPAPCRDFVYNIIAKNRYKWFGKKASCKLPSKEDRNRFL